MSQGKLILEKNFKLKISCQTPFKKIKNTLFYFVLGRVNYFAEGLPSITVEVYFVETL
jgi:hypothetical protein